MTETISNTYYNTKSIKNKLLEIGEFINDFQNTEFYNKWKYKLPIIAKEINKLSIEVQWKSKSKIKNSDINNAKKENKMKKSKN